uniref:DDB1- and CUL4-associated factor 15 WD40 repeat-containing domain-containing protein n=1 Tax=Romanomermis culicivorax TaxID=13658 RepID=A0A915J7J8_ROMCU
MKSNRKTTNWTYWLYWRQIWRFVPGKKLLKIRSLKLFPEARICSELHITLTQFPCDPHVVTVFGLETQNFRDSNFDEASTETYFSIISLKRYLLHNGNFCHKEHNLIANFSMICTVSGDIPLFNCFALSDMNVCTVFDDSTVSASAVLDIETLLQDGCEMVCKRNNLTFMGFRDYETYVVDVMNSQKIAILFGVLIEMEEADYPLAEIVFLFTGNLLSPDWDNLSKIKQCAHDQCQIMGALIDDRSVAKNENQSDLRLLETDKKI